MQVKRQKSGISTLSKFHILFIKISTSYICGQIFVQFEKELKIDSLFPTAAQNSLRSLPDSFCRLESLTWLQLSKNSIEYLPDDIGLLQQLEVMKLDCNLVSTMSYCERPLSKHSFKVFIFYGKIRQQKNNKPALSLRVVSDTLSK